MKNNLCDNENEELITEIDAIVYGLGNLRIQGITMRWVVACMIVVGVKIIIFNSEEFEKTIAWLEEEKRLHKGHSLWTGELKRAKKTVHSLVR